MGGSPISSALDTGGGAVSPNVSSKAESTASTTTNLNLGGSTGPVLYLGDTGPKTSTWIILGLAVVVVIYFLRGR